MKLKTKQFTVTLQSAYSYTVPLHQNLALSKKLDDEEGCPPISTTITDGTRVENITTSLATALRQPEL
jgi:hypothetical protein